MQYEANTPDEYIAQIPEDRKEAIRKLRQVINYNLPEGFVEVMNCGMISYVVPHSLYPQGYHVNPKEPLPFMSIASQKHFVAVYHMGVYAIPTLLEWFVSEYPNHSNTKLDMGKSCIRMKKIEQIPYKLIGELVSKINVDDWIKLCEDSLKNYRKKK